MIGRLPPAPDAHSGPGPIRACSGAASGSHTGRYPLPVRIGIGTAGRYVWMCRECRDAAGRLGIIDRRETER